jgi:hypothetical protein
MQAAQHTVIPQKCHLYKQPKSSNWFCRIKVDGGKWIRLTTGETKLAAAREKAHELYFETRTKVQNKLPIQTKTFSSVAKSIVAQLEDRRDTDEWKSAYQSYIYAINKYQIPYFKNTKLSNIKEHYKGYVEYFADQIGHAPAASTLNNHHAALRLILDKAVEHGWLINSALPLIKNAGKESTRRPTFSIAEYNKMITKLRAWKDKDTHRKKDAEIRDLLYDYVLILAYSGIRHGREAMDIKWKNISFAKSNAGNDIIVVNVLMKKGRKATERRRDVVLRHNELSDSKQVLERLKNRQVKLQGYALEDLIEKRRDEKLFALSDGTQVKRIDGTFKKFLIDSKLQVGADEQNRTLYSLRHFYATQEMLRKHPISIHLLAKQMGTSINMIEQHYSHLEAFEKADKLSGWEEF